jgi:glycosyltransferase involved in cell wall biosynthesis
LPADGDFEAARRAAEPGADVFSGGSAGRDFRTLVEAVRDTALSVEIVTFDPGALGTPPANVRVRGPMPVQAFLTRMAGAAVVAVPLDGADSPHGQTTMVQALALEKPVVATRSGGMVDYVDDGEDGFLVEARDVAGLRAALLRIAGDDELRSRLAASARARAEDLSYVRYAERLTVLCGELL